MTSEHDRPTTRCPCCGGDRALTGDTYRRLIDTVTELRERVARLERRTIGQARVGAAGTDWPTTEQMARRLRDG